MNRVLMAVTVVLAGFVGGTPWTFAESKPIQQLPEDLARWSTLWVELPREIGQVGEAHGPLAAATWGPVKGTAQVVRSTVKEVWNAAKTDQTGGRHAGPGALFRYEF